MKIKDILENVPKQKLLIEAPESLLLEQLDEATRVKIGNYTARRDPPHFQGDEYHAHVELPGGYEVAWSKSGARRHPTKFPAAIPNDAKVAVAQILGVSVELLEGYLLPHENEGERVLLILVREG